MARELGSLQAGQIPAGFPPFGYWQRPRDPISVRWIAVRRDTEKSIGGTY